jgi:hypothetical protein
MVINSSGNVGIGTSSPAQKLDVNGSVVISPNTAGKNTFSLTTNASNDGSLFIKSDTTDKVNIQANGSSYFEGGTVRFISTISVGNSTPSTSGAGLTFPATQSASSNANTLDDYEEGTFSIAATGGVTTVSGTPAYSGYYTKIGRLVNVTMRQTAGVITFAANSSSFGYLPFPPAIINQACAVTDGGPTISGSGLVYLSGSGGQLYTGFAAANISTLTITATYFTD